MPSPKRVNTLDMPPRDIIPPAFSYANKEQADSPGLVAYPSNPRNASVSSARNFKNDIESGADASYSIDSNHVYLNPAKRLEQGDDRQIIIPHELGHALWDTTLPDLLKQQWTHIHHNVLYPKDYNNLYSFKERPGLLDQYQTSPSHSFAEAYGLYVGQPEKMEQYNPRIYNWFRAAIGREYKKRDKSEASSTAAGIPFYWSTPQK